LGTRRMGSVGGKPAHVARKRSGVGVRKNNLGEDKKETSTRVKNTAGKERIDETVNTGTDPQNQDKKK